MLPYLVQVVCWVSYWITVVLGLMLWSALVGWMIDAVKATFKRASR